MPSTTHCAYYSRSHPPGMPHQRNVMPLPPSNSPLVFSGLTLSLHNYLPLTPIRTRTWNLHSLKHEQPQKAEPFCTVWSLKLEMKCSQWHFRHWRRARWPILSYRGGGLGNEGWGEGIRRNRGLGWAGDCHTPSPRLYTCTVQGLQYCWGNSQPKHAHVTKDEGDQLGIRFVFR